MTIVRVFPSHNPLLDGPTRERRSLDIVAFAFLLSIASFIASSLWDWGVLEFVIKIPATASCGFSWLLARSFFRSDASNDTWPIFVVGLLIAIGLLLDSFAAERTGSGVFSTALGMAASLHALLSSTVLLLAFLEAWFNYSHDFPRNEKRFRLIFMAFYGVLLTVAILWLNGSSEGSWAERSGDSVRLFSAAIAAFVSIIGWQYRRNNPHPRPKRPKRIIVEASEDEQDLSERIIAKLREEKLFLEPDLKLSDLASVLHEHDHKLRNCITGVLGFRNFNHLINHYRVMSAKDALTDSRNRSASILSIAFECGFSSIGPFNRAFKQETGQTPSSFRRNIAQ